jgi:hypothetical protein
MKTIFVILTLTIFSNCIEWVHYNACNNAWKDIPSWIRKIKPDSKDTICFLEYQKHTGVYLDGWLLTALSTGLTSYGVRCNDRECTPEVVNRFIEENYENPEAFSLIGIKKNGKFEKDEIKSRLDAGDIVMGVSQVIDGVRYAFVVKNVIENGGIECINNFGIDVTYELNQYDGGLVSFTILNKLKFLF